MPSGGFREKLIPASLQTSNGARTCHCVINRVSSVNVVSAGYQPSPRGECCACGRGVPSAMPLGCTGAGARLASGFTVQPRLESDDMSRRQHRSQVLNARHGAHARHGAQRQHRSQVLSAGGRRSAALSAAVHLDGRPCPLAPGAVPDASLAPRACGDPSSHRSPAEGHYAVIQWAISGQSVPISRQSLGNQ